MSQISPSGPGALRLIFPQWQGASGPRTHQLLPGVDAHDSQLSYSMGPALLELMSPDHDGPTAYVPVSTDTSDEALATVNGIYARDAVVRQLTDALRLLREAAPSSVVTFGGECSVSVAPFSYLASIYADDLAVLWIDAHPDTGVPGQSYTGFRSMALATLAGEGDAGIISELPALVPPLKILQVGLRHWDDEGIAVKERLGIQSVGITDTTEDGRRVLDWIAAAGATKLAVHIDLDVLDPRDFTSSMGRQTDGMRMSDLVRLVGDVSTVAEVVGLSLTEHAPVELMRLSGMLRGLPV
ncbi:arginase family protein [Arthrobacter sp. zg-Y820]|uniref:arginase family protein n=1 Tax=unclassified Arthrobacter TaxID=235627 RepID=UPI001E47FD34|nr:MULTISPECIES: arginase family protein [unclassified Arthrobacter]MCC9196540.1 arginase family protein [Arthrobacter sp. zg-Y820]MDK1279402.1 arginase family protein [Arthrobacter sp. zg.Y820]WIB08217.1 arginase family protein [Arthrobacter sp. zg-Y820]